MWGVPITDKRGQTVVTVKLIVIVGNLVISGNLTSGPALEGGNIGAGHTQCFE